MRDPCISEGREKTPRMEGVNQRGKRIPRNTPRVNGPGGGRRQPEKEWAGAGPVPARLIKGRK
jgi:hypothetical protein